MSLLVWLPLDGDTHNQGIAPWNFSVSNTSMITVDNNGKIGKCYNFNSTAINYGIYSADNGFMNQYINNKSWSFVAWVNTTSSATCVAYFSYGLSFWAGNASNTKLTLSNSTRTITCTSSVGVNDGKWHHIVGTYDHLTGKICFYIDGIQTGTTNYTSGETYASSWSNGLYIGRNPNNSNVNDSYLYKGKMNDFRVYSKALSAAEVKEISQGLVIHYKLDDIPQNYSKNKNTSWTNITLGRYYATIFSYNMADFQIATGAKNGDKFTWSLDLKSVSGNKPLAARVQHYNSESDRNSVIGNYIAVNEEGRSSITFTVNTNYSRLDFVIQNGDTTNATSNTTEQYKNTKIEAGNVSTAWAPIGITPIIQDSSGYNHNAIITGTPILTSDTARYGASVSMNADTFATLNNTIFQSTALNSELTWSGWIRRTNAESVNMHMYCGIVEIRVSTSYPFLITWNHATDSSSSTNSWAPSVSLTQNEWCHVAITFKDGILKSYLNGQYKNTSDRSSTGQFIKGTRGSSLFANGTNDKFIGQLSDMRVYTTCLSDDDIKSLYNVGASIDNKQNLHTYEIREQDNSVIQLLKTGVFLEDELIESDSTQFKSDKIVETNEIIEI